MQPFWNLRDAMNWADVLFSPKGTLKPRTFAIVVIGVYALNLIAGSVFDGQFMVRAGFWPYLGLQIMLTWIWFVAHSKRLRDAGKGSTVAFILAFLYLAGIIAMLSLAAGSASAVTQSNEPSQEASGSLIGVLIAVLFINTLLTGDPFLIVGFFILLIGLPLIFTLIVVIYSIVTGARQSLTPEVAAVLPAAVRPAPPAQASKPPSPFS
jgi:hypothetical protein